MGQHDHLDSEIDESLRRIAIQMAGMLPPGREHTETVLTYLRHTVDRVLYPPPRTLRVVNGDQPERVASAANDLESVQPGQAGVPWIV